MSDSRPQTSVEDYIQILNLRGSDGLPRIVVGGHAVNIWAEYYLSRTPQLAPFFPFVSKDLDLLGTPVDLEMLALKTGHPCVRSKNKMFIPSTGYIVVPLKDGQQAKVEVLKRIYGISTEEIRKGAIEINRRQISIRVIDPIRLLHAKTENAVHLSQNVKDFERQDERHMRIMIICACEYLKEALKATRDSKTAIRNCLDLHEAVISFARSDTAKRASKMYGVDWLEVFPLQELKNCADARIQNFCQIRLPQCFPDLKVESSSHLKKAIRGNRSSRTSKD